MYFFLEEGHVHSLLAHHLEHCLQGPFVTDAHVVLILVEDEFLIFLVDGVVSQVHTHILHVFFIRCYVSLRGKSAESLSEDEDPEWIYACHQHVDA